MAQEHKQPSKTSQEEDETVEAAPSTNEQKAELDSEIDDLLSEIDGVLESNAEEFVKSFIQKGGQ